MAASITDYDAPLNAPLIVRFFKRQESESDLLPAP